MQHDPGVRVCFPYKMSPEARPGMLGLITFFGAAFLLLPFLTGMYATQGEPSASGAVLAVVCESVPHLLLQSPLGT
jgi:hypothetical protein